MAIPGSGMDPSGFNVKDGVDADLKLLREKEMGEETRKVKVQPWLHGRIALSEQGARFGIPVDVVTLETMTVHEYLRKFTVICARREHLYKKIFLRNKEKTTPAVILWKNVEQALSEVLVNTWDKGHMELLCAAADLKEGTNVDERLFGCLCALAERLLYSHFLTEDTENVADFQREKLELADFHALEWRLRGINVNPAVKDLLDKLNCRK